MEIRIIDHHIKIFEVVKIKFSIFVYFDLGYLISIFI